VRNVGNSMGALASATGPACAGRPATDTNVVESSPHGAHGRDPGDRLGRALGILKSAQYITTVVAAVVFLGAIIALLSIQGCAASGKCVGPDAGFSELVECGAEPALYCVTASGADCLSILGGASKLGTEDGLFDYLACLAKPAASCAGNAVALCRECEELGRAASAGLPPVCAVMPKCLTAATKKCRDSPDPQKCAHAEVTACALQAQNGCKG